MNEKQSEAVGAEVVIFFSMKLLGIINVVLSEILSTARSDGPSLGPASTNYYCV